MPAIRLFWDGWRNRLPRPQISCYIVFQFKINFQSSVLNPNFKNAQKLL